ncbi:uncharacterized protein LOC133203696 [Saccostrea echinata]|uniref:uncharacterized protein LOC133203696 n=1 Tax=Saccostrea echinata TaxID=191078 RepID=UPI002A832B8F|nr:uncharacterized protein LOC133203696 [Saccostrea echinata]
MVLDSRNLIVGSSASMSSVFSNGYPPHLASYAVDNITDCIYTNVAATQREENPWLRIDLGMMFDVQHVLVYARPDGFEPGRTHNLLTTVSNDEQNHTCGFYPGPTDLGDRIAVICNNLTRGRYVTLTIQSNSGKKDILQVCEIKVFGKP